MKIFYRYLLRREMKHFIEYLEEQERYNELQIPLMEKVNNKDAVKFIEGKVAAYHYLAFDLKRKIKEI